MKVAAKERTPAEALPVARVCVDIPIPHLDRLFDYLVPAEWDGKVTVGCRVRVRFAGRLVDGFVLDRVEKSEHTGKLSYIARAVSAEAVLTPEIAQLATRIAARQAGMLNDVLRLAIPPRHARAESEVEPPRHARAGSEVESPRHVSDERWSRYTHGESFLAALAQGHSPRAVWQSLPGENWPTRLAELADAVLASGRGVLFVVPDARDVDRMDSALGEVLGKDSHVVLTASLGPQERYRRWLSVLRGQKNCVVGTRAAVFAPVKNLGLVAIWDDGDDVLAEPRAPYCHARETLLMRAHCENAAAVVAGISRTPEAQLLVDTGWAHSLVAERGVVRLHAPRIVSLDERSQAVDGPARLPSVAYKAARDSLSRGAPVLVQVARKGYVPAMCCAQCRHPARCRACRGPLGNAGGGRVNACGWCGYPATDWVCGQCGSRRFRPAVAGARRTAEELGRAFTGTPVVTSSSESIVAAVPYKPAIVVATLGAEPYVDKGLYGAVLLLDTWSSLTRPDLRAGQEAFRRWISAAALAQPASDNGTVVVVAEGSLAPVQALVRWDPIGFAERELADRAELSFPPVVRMAKLVGTAHALGEIQELVKLPEGADVLGPVPTGRSSGDSQGIDEQEQLLIRVDRAQSQQLADALSDAIRIRSARKAKDPVRVEIDPSDIG